MIMMELKMVLLYTVVPWVAFLVLRLSNTRVMGLITKTQVLMFLPPGAVYPQPRGGGGSKREQRGQGWTRWQEEEEQVREIQSCSSFCLKTLLHDVISGKALICPWSRCAVCKKKLGLTGFTCRYFDLTLLPQRNNQPLKLNPISLCLNSQPLSQVWGTLLLHT